MKLKDAPWKESSVKFRQHIKKQRQQFSNKGPIVKVTIFPVVMYRYESWTIKKAERQRTDAFELWCWRRSLRVSWTARRSNQSILKEINPEYSPEGLKLQYFGHLIWTADSLEKTLMQGKTEGSSRRGATEDETVGWHYWLNGHACILSHFSHVQLFVTP